MEALVAESPTLRLLAQALTEPLLLVDVGCSGGIAPVWRGLEPRLAAFGFDPVCSEIQRLKAEEANPLIHYRAGFVGGAPDGTPPTIPPYVGPAPERWAFMRSQSNRAARTPVREEAELLRENRWEEVRLADRERAIFIPGLLAELNAPPIDFIKIDCDGPDFEILQGFSDVFAAGHVLGAMLEVNFYGGHEADQNSFHNTDRFMRAAGFHLVGLTVRPYSMSALPFPYMMNHPQVGSAFRGRPFQGDAVYVRDVVADGIDRSPAQLHKAVAVYCVAGLPDHAAEVVTTYRDAFTDPDGLLNALTAELEALAAPLFGRPGRTYAEHLAAFHADDPSLFSGEYRRIMGRAP